MRCSTAYAIRLALLGAAFRQRFGQSSRMDVHFQHALETTARAISSSCRPQIDADWALQLGQQIAQAEIAPHSAAWRLRLRRLRDATWRVDPFRRYFEHCT